MKEKSIPTSAEKIRKMKISLERKTTRVWRINGPSAKIGVCAKIASLFVYDSNGRSLKVSFAFIRNKKLRRVEPFSDNRRVDDAFWAIVRSFA